MLTVNGSDKADCQVHWHLLRAQGRSEVGSKEEAGTLRQTRAGRIRRPKERWGRLRGGGPYMRCRTLITLGAAGAMLAWLVLGEYAYGALSASRGGRSSTRQVPTA